MMLHTLKRHPIPIVAHFDQCLVLTYALPAGILEPLLPPGLVLDTVGDLGFVAVAMVQTRGLRPRGLPACVGQDFFLAGYRIFARHTDGLHITRRGLRILRSDTDRRLMVNAGNLLTHYNYYHSDIRVTTSTNQLQVRIVTDNHDADLHVVADLSTAGVLPANSPFCDERQALRFAGPLPYTFDYESQTHSIIMIKGVRRQWKPRLVNVNVLTNTFFNKAEFATAKPVLASAFHVTDIDYRWQRGVRHQLEDGAT